VLSLIGDPLSLVGLFFSLIRDLIATVGDPLPVVG
jgi:hypothetical protein